MNTLTLGEIAQLLGCDKPPRAERPISGMAALDEASESEIAFLSAETFIPAFEKTRAAAVIVARRIKLPRPPHVPLLIVDDADLAVATVLERFAPPIPRPPVGVDPTARIAPTATLGQNIAVGPYVLIGQRCRIGDGTILHPNVVIGDDVEIGDNCEFFPNVVLRERITIGRRVIIHAGSVLGTDGFGYRWDGAQHRKVPQIGSIIVEDDVEIGSCVCIDRAKFGFTRIGRGTKIDNLVQIGHNVRVGPHCIIVGQAGVAGSAVLGSGVVLGGQSAVRDHVTMADGSAVAACSGVWQDVEPKTIVSGLPALPHRQSLREQAALRRLPDLVVQVRKLQEEIEKLKTRP